MKKAHRIVRLRLSKNSPEPLKHGIFHKRVFLLIEVFLSVFAWYRFKAVDGDEL